MRFIDFHRSIQLRIALSFLTSTANNMVLPFMSIYFAGKLGDTAAGAVVIIGILAGVICGIFGGYYADRIGRKKMMVLAEGIWAVCFLVMAWSNSPWFESPIITFAMMVLVSMSWGIHGPASEAMVLDVTTPETRKYVYGIMYWVNNLSFVISGMVGAFLFKSYLFELFIGLAVVAVISLFITTFFIHETYVPHPKEDSASEAASGGIFTIFSSYKLVLKDSTFMVFVVASLLLVSVEFHLGNYVGIRLEKEMVNQKFFSWNDFTMHIDGLKMLGFLRTENTLLVVLLSMVIRRIIQKYSDQKVMFFGFICYISGYSYLAYSNQPWLLLAAMGLATLGELLYVPIMQSYMGDIAPDHARSSYMALYGMVYRGAILLAGGGVILGGILSSWTMAVLILLCGLVGMGLLYSIIPALENRKTVKSSASAGQEVGM
jgi:DHA1 family multidrug resistance protein B-like MFS transporter